MLKSLLEPLSEYREYEEIVDDLKKGRAPIEITGCIDVQKCHFMEALGKAYKYKVVITYNDTQAKKLCEEYSSFAENVLYYPAGDFLFYQADIKGNELAAARMQVVEKLLSGESAVVVTSIDSGLSKRQPLSAYQDAAFTIEEGETVDTKKLEKKLVKMGYEKKPLVESPGEYTVRGGIFDIYPLSSAAPYRIELWGDEVDTIRIFDAGSQRSIEKIEKCYIYPASEHVYSEEELEAGIQKIDKETKRLYDKLRKEFKTEEAARLLRATEHLKDDIKYFYHSVNLDSYIEYFCEDSVSLFSYFPEDETVFFMEEPQRVTSRALALSEEYEASMQERLLKGYALPKQASYIYSYKSILGMLANKRLATIATLATSKEIHYKKSYNITAKSVASYRADFPLLCKDLTVYKKQGYKIIIFSSSRTRAKRLSEDLGEYELSAFTTEDVDRVLLGGEIMVAYGNVQKGFEYPLIKLVVISEVEIFGASVVKKSKKPSVDGRKLLDFNSLTVGDYVIHENHGMGIYKGIFKINSDNVEKDYIKLEYGGGGVLYVPVTALNLMQKYSGGDGAKPKLAKLNSPEWTATKSKVRASINEIAEELVTLYAKRSKTKGFAFSKDNVWQREFEELFPYEETGDQLKAISDTKSDMESEKIMDRLVCGDVGYGKTEIALRAAFKAVQDSKQVAILVPTTILAQQHFNTFAQRLKDFPITVDVLSRFKSKAQQTEALKRLKTGELDIVIGTHRLLSKDVAFKNLGLLIVDEEQRFGVTHKEKIKELKTSVDVLTLTATPIPRTMHMSLIGIRDMSILDEPPAFRLPVQTFCLEYNAEIVREAIERELARGGQVYYVHNRVVGIDDVAAKLSAMLPDARITYAHGKMSERVLEDIMYSFINGEIDVLVSTTIIETGMDIPNVNTIIIDDCDRFGLSQLYQLRGRVGRSTRTAYAFLMYKSNMQLKEDAEKRLSAIREFTELGAGYKIAMKDLEIRGAGNLLGVKQSGHMCAVGYDLYCKMLNEAVLNLKGETLIDSFETSIDINVNAFIPATYIKNEIIKLDAYKRIAAIENEEDVSDMIDELTDRFGDMPKEVHTLLRVSLLRSLAAKVYVTDIKQKGNILELKLYEKAKLDVAKFGDYIGSYKGRCRLVRKNTTSFTHVLGAKNELQLLKEINDILVGMQCLLCAPEEKDNEENS